MKTPLTNAILKKLLPALLALAILAAAVPGLAGEAEAPGEELLKNGDFSGPLNWQLYTESGGSAALSVADGELRVDVSDVGRVAHAIQPYYDGFRLSQGVVYRIGYDVRSSAPRQLYVRIQLNGGDYRAYYEELIDVTPELRHHEAEFTMEEPSDPTPRLCVNMGLAGEGAESLGAHQVYFDNFSLTVVDVDAAVAEVADADATGIRVNQLGWRPDAVKRAVFADVATESDAFRVVDAVTGEAVFEGALAAAWDNPWAGETNRVADFSALAQPGVYRVESAEGVQSPAFAIGEDVYAELFRAAARMLYLQRCGVALDADFAAAYAHPACHAAMATVYGTDEKIDVGGGWHDAGDYGRYVVSGAKAAADMMLAAEALGTLTDDVGIPESGDGLDDLLQEAKVELDWMLKMQASDGGVYHKVTCRNFPAFVAPQEETDELVVCPVSNTATADFAAVMAMASRLYAADWPEDAARYLAAAERAWAYLEDHEGAPGFANPPDVVTGEYGDGRDGDERFWAAAELHRATGGAAYREAALALIATEATERALGWQNVGAYGVLAVLADDSLAGDDALRAAARTALETAVRDARAMIDANPYGADRAESYEWGSNMGVAGTGALLALAADLLGDEALRRDAQQPLDYLLGRNATGYCFVTGAGTKCPEHPHHRPSTAAGAAMPGMLVGGPDNALEDTYARSVLAGNPPAKCYADSDQTYSTNEVCVYWNSPLVLLLAAMA